MDFFTIAVSSVPVTYSADDGDPENYRVNLGTTTSDGLWTYKPPIITYAPYSRVKITALNTGNVFWTSNIVWLRFYFNDQFDQVPWYVQMSKSTFLASGATHIYGPPWWNYIGMTKCVVTGAVSAITSHYIANVKIGEIPPRPAMSIFDSDGNTAVLDVSAHSPLTLYFAATSTRAGSFPIESLTWSFGDRTPERTVTNFETEDPQFSLFGIPHHVNDPRNYLVPHIFKRLGHELQGVRGNIIPALQVQSMVTTMTSAVTANGEVGPLRWAVPETRRLIKSRCFDADNKILLISETDEGQVYQHLILSLSGLRAHII